MQRLPTHETCRAPFGKGPHTFRGILGGYQARLLGRELPHRGMRSLIHGKA